MKNITLDYTISNDLSFFLESEKSNIEDASKQIGISKNTTYEILNKKEVSKEVCEKFYSYIYNLNYRINTIKEELYKENYNLVLFHGSKFGLNNIDCNGSRSNCDFGNGFYLGESYEKALFFVCENKNSSVYAFSLNLDNLNVLKFKCDLEWMLAICYYRGQLKNYEESLIIKQIIKKIEEADIIIAPIADNRMFYIMSLFTNGDINVDVAIHSLSASNMGLQYIIKTEKGLENLLPLEKLYISIPEKEDCHNKLEERSKEIETKLKMAKREYRNGKFIEEIL